MHSPAPLPIEVPRMVFTPKQAAGVQRVNSLLADQGAETVDNSRLPQQNSSRGRSD
jgi:hypothetical protein